MKYFLNKFEFLLTLFSDPFWLYFHLCLLSKLKVKKCVLIFQDIPWLDLFLKRYLCLEYNRCRLSWMMHVFVKIAVWLVRSNVLFGNVKAVIVMWSCHMTASLFHLDPFESILFCFTYFKCNQSLYSVNTINHGYFMTYYIKIWFVHFCAYELW